MMKMIKTNPSSENQKKKLHRTANRSTEKSTAYTALNMILNFSSASCARKV